MKVFPLRADAHMHMNTATYSYVCKDWAHMHVVYKHTNMYSIQHYSCKQ